MDYESLLEEAYENVKEVETIKGTNGCERFEVLDVSGHHAGSRTIITNFGKVASCIRRDPRHLLRFLSKELASSGEISGGRLILSRKVSSREVNDKIKKYANIFVFCPKCKKPDTDLYEENGGVFLKCFACGTKKEVYKI